MVAGDYLKYAKEAEYEPQALFLDSGDAFELEDELRRLGTRRILFLCNTVTVKFKGTSDLIGHYTDKGFRCFKYVRKEPFLNEVDVFGGLGVYKEFNCDTIITIGGTADIDCGKLVAAAAVNPVKELSEFAGLNKLKKDISVLCCIVTDNSASPTTLYAEYYDTKYEKWNLCMSSYLIPQIVVVDTDFSVRTEMAWALGSSFSALACAVEAYISPASMFNSPYRANAVNACYSIFTNIKKLKDDPDDSYARRLLSVGGLYSGIASRMFGLGYAHIITNYMISRYGVAFAAYHLPLLTKAMELYTEKCKEDLSDLARELHLCTMSSSVESAASTFVAGLRRICDMTEYNMPKVDLSDSEITRIADDTRRDAANYGLYFFETKDLVQIMTGTFERIS